MTAGIEKRTAPRIVLNSAIELSANGKDADLVNLSETGVCFECNGSLLSGDIELSMSFSKTSPHVMPISGRVVYHAPVEENRNRYGVQFLSDNMAEQLREKIFNEFAQNAVVDIKDPESKSEAEKFFKVDVRHFHETLTHLVQDAATGMAPDTVEGKMTALVDDILNKGSELEKKVADESAMKRVKEVFREIAGCWLYKSPIVKMAYDKPRGYPGDYFLFEKIYEGAPQAEKGTIGYYGDKYFLNNTYAQAARARKNKMKNILQDQIENSSSKTLKLLNVACGPSREIRELLYDPYLTKKKEISFTGLDYDEESLKFSQEKFDKLPPNIKVRLIHADVLKIFRDPKYYDLIGKQDVIYILGLTEYLPDRVFRKLTKFLFTLLNDKGKLVITYKDQAIEFPSLPPEWFCDWAFIKRTKEDLLKTAEEIGSDQFTLNIEREGTGTIYFFILTKK